MKEEVNQKRHTFDKRHMDRELPTVDRKVTQAVWCLACKKYVTQLTGCTS